jgi:DNA-binding PadR family transcriptional regulator
MDSPSQYWSASSGATYPLVLRLRKRGLIRVNGKTGDGREGNLYVLTTAGLQALVGWLGTLDAPASVSVPPDPLRSRIAFFELLDRQKQRDVLASAIKAMKCHLEQVRAYTKRQQAEGHSFEQLISDGARRVVETRLEWLLEIQRILGHGRNRGNRESD